MAVSTTFSMLLGSTPNTTNPVAPPHAKTTAAPPGLFSTSDGRVLLAFLVFIFLLMIALPVLSYFLGKRFCWIRVHDPERGKWRTDDIQPRPTEDNTKSTQTDVLGIEFDEFYRRRKPIDMSKYTGKPLSEVEEPYPRFFQINPTDFNDPWTLRHAGKETNYLTKQW